jgi:hypothetical protein
MSLKEEQSQEHNLRAGLAMFHTPLVHSTNLDGEVKSNDQAPVTKDSNNASPVHKVQTNPTSSTPSTVKFVGSNRFIFSIDYSKSYTVLFS